MFSDFFAKNFRLDTCFQCGIKGEHLWISQERIHMCCGCMQTKWRKAKKQWKPKPEIPVRDKRMFNLLQHERNDIPLLNHDKDTPQEIISSINRCTDLLPYNKKVIPFFGVEDTLVQEMASLDINKPAPSIDIAVIESTEKKKMMESEIQSEYFIHEANY